MGEHVAAVRYDDLSSRQKRAMRDAYIDAQDGNCYHCKMPLIGPPATSVMAKRITPHLYPPNFFKFPVHLHHSHQTGMTIGAVHNRCNAVLWEHHGE